MIPTKVPTVRPKCGIWGGVFVCKCLKSLAPQDEHISEHANGEFWRTDFLQDVNQGRNFGFVSGLGRLGKWQDFADAHFHAVSQE